MLPLYGALKLQQRFDMAHSKHLLREVVSVPAYHMGDQGLIPQCRVTLFSYPQL